MKKKALSLLLVTSMIGILSISHNVDNPTKKNISNNIIENHILLENPTSSTTQGQWINNNNTWSYQFNSGVDATSWQDINGNWYYFNQNGNMYTGWLNLNGHYYYLKNSGEMSTGWNFINNQWYYMKNSGEMSTGWQFIDNSWFYFNNNGYMQKNWQNINGNWYYFQSSGRMLQNWQEINNQWYYFKDTGAMLTGWQDINGTKFYFNPSGDMASGWTRINNSWHYFTTSGYMLTSWQEINGKWYYFDNSGQMLTGWIQYNNHLYYAGNDGALKIGYQKIGNDYYYFANGGAVETGWINENNNWYFGSKTGALLTGWQNINGTKYYFDQTGKMFTGTHLINGYISKFSNTGALISSTSNSTYTKENYDSTLTDYVAAQLQQYNNVMGGQNGFSKAKLAQLKTQLTNAINPAAANDMYEFLNVNTYRNVNEAAFAQALQGKGVFSGQAEAFINAAKKYNIDPVYLMAQSALETNWGTSNFAKGITITKIQEVNSNGQFVTKNGEPVMINLPAPVKVYNLFGIGAFNTDPTVGATTYAYDHGWTSIPAAIDGSAQFLDSHYLDNQIKQDTPYELRYINGPLYDIWHQYSTEIQYAQSLSDIIAQNTNLYSITDTFVFNVPKFEEPTQPVNHNLKQVPVTAQEFAVIHNIPMKNTVESSKIAKEKALITNNN
ncbi:MAG: glucosaminidase domain-containing protein [Sarcina sp.]